MFEQPSDVSSSDEESPDDHCLSSQSDSDLDSNHSGCSSSLSLIEAKELREVSAVLDDIYHEAKDEREAEVHEEKLKMGKPSEPIVHYSWVHPSLEAREGPFGCGLYANERVQKNETLVVWTGRILSAEEALPIMDTEDRHYILQVGEGFYQVPFGKYREPADWTNHSCDPNAGFGKKSPIILSAMRDIEVNEQILFDYGMCETDPRLWEPMECQCNTQYCRKWITTDDYKRPELWERYEGYWSPHVLECIQKYRQPIGSPSSASSSSSAFKANKKNQSKKAYVWKHKKSDKNPKKKKSQGKGVNMIRFVRVA